MKNQSETWESHRKSRTSSYTAYKAVGLRSPVKDGNLAALSNPDAGLITD